MAYFLKKSNLKKGLYLQIYESHHDKEKGRPVNKSVKALGYVSDLEASGIEDPVEFYSEEVRKMNDKLRNDRAMEKTRQIKDDPRINLGCFPLKRILDKLDVRKYINYFQLATDFRFNIYDTLSALVLARCIHPCSKLATFHDTLPLLYGRPDVSYDQILECCEFIGNEYGKFVEIFTRATAKVYGSCTDYTYFDCTNFYFEIDREDDFRKKGPSKENRKDPIVGLGLLLDANQIPIGMRMFPGNESEKPVLREVIDSLKKQNNIKGKTIQVADKGLNCADNIVAALKNSDGYIFSKAVKMLPETEKVWVLLDTDWNEVIGDDGKLRYRYKTCTDLFPYTYNDEDGSEKTVRLKEKRVVTYNPKLAEKKKIEIRRMAEKAKKLSASQAKRSEFGDCGKYVSFTTKDDAKVITKVNQEAIDKDMKFAGYNLLVTSECDLDAKDIYAIYHNLWRIEESFRIMKSNLDARPVFLQKENSIKGHFLICYIAVLLERIFQFKELENKYSSGEIDWFVKEFSVMNVMGKEYVNISKATPFTSMLATRWNLPLTNYHLTRADIKKIMGIS